MFVMLSHLRAFVFVDYAESGVSDPLWKAFYFFTGLGHQAVMIFFVLSGYFVGGSVLAGLRKGSFTISRYAIARLSRLWTVLIPTLALTLLLDAIGRQMAPQAYAGLYGELFLSGPSLDHPISNGLPTLLGNLLFLQTIEVPVYGTNGPLWSLANEFWYYALFPLLILAVTTTFRELQRRQSGQWLRWTTPIGLISLCAILLFWLPANLLAYGFIWLMGVLVWIAANVGPFARHFGHWVSRMLPAPLFAAALVASKTDSWFGSDWMVAATFALWMPGLLGPWPKTGWWSRVATALSELSYTLYVVHFPLLFFIVALAIGGHQWPPNAAGLLVFALLALGVLAFSTLWWWLFERRTQDVRRWMNRMLPRATVVA